MHAYHKLKEMLCKELEEIVNKGELTAGSLETIDKLTHSIKSLETIMAMEEAGYSNEGGYSGYGNSGARRRDSMGRYADGGSYGSYYRDGGMDEGYSGRRYSEGYSGRRYSRDEGKSQMIQQMEMLMENAQSQEEREVMKQALNKLKNM